MSDINDLNGADRDHQLRLNESALALLHDQTLADCKVSVGAFGLTLKHVKVQTPGLCMLSVSRDGDALQYVEDQTWDVCQAAIEKSPLSLRFVRSKQSQICMKAVKLDGFALQYVPAAFPGRAPGFEGPSIEEITLAAVTECGTALQFAKVQTQEIVDVALASNKLAKRYALPQFLEGKKSS